MKRRFGPIFLSSILGFWTLGGAAEPNGVQEKAEEKTDHLIESLEGADGDKGTLAARDLIAQMVDAKSPKAEEYRKYLQGALDPGRIAQGGGAVSVAERLVGALAYTAAANQPYPPEGPDLVLKLLGAGTEGLRKVVGDGICSFARAEVRRGGESKVIPALAAILQGEPPPTPMIIEEVSRILWRVNGKEFFKALIGALSKGRSRPPGELGPYIFALRQRLDIDFPSVKEWEAWWTENQDQPIEVILESGRRELRVRQVELWRKILRRLEGAVDPPERYPETYLGAITDSLELAPTQDLQAAAVEALGGFPAWLRESKFPLKKNGEPVIDEAGKTALASRGLGQLVKLLGGADPRSFVSPWLKRKVLIALRGYAAHLERNPQEGASAFEAVLAGFRSIFPGKEGKAPSIPADSWAGARDDLLELVRTAGALKIPSSRAYLERILQEGTSLPRDDPELAVEAISALGRVLDRGVEREPVELIMRWFRTNNDLASGAQRGIRKACVSALNLKVDSPDLRDQVRRFYTEEVLGKSEDKVGRVPAILGLGILAKGGDREAADALALVLARRDTFDPAEVTAAIDALAYLGGREALARLLRFIDEKDQPLADSVWQKVLSILKGQGLELLQWTMAWIYAQAQKSDQPELAGIALKLSEEPELASLLSPARLSAAEDGELLACWDAVLIRTRALQLAGNESKASQEIASLLDAGVKSGRLKKIRPRAEEELTQERGRLARLLEVKGSMLREPKAFPPGLVQDLVSIPGASGDAESRWRNLHWVLLQLRGLKPSPEGILLIQEVLRVFPEQPFWAEVPADVQGNFLKALESHRETLKAALPVSPGSG